MKSSIGVVRESRHILIITSLLTSIGLVMLYSASAIFAANRLGQGPYFFLAKQFLWLIIGMGLFFVLSNIDITVLKKYSILLLIIAIVLLILVFVPGIGAQIKGARRWIRVGEYSFQPSEFMKMALAIFVSAYLASVVEIKDLKKGFLPCFGIIALVAGLVIIEPDIGGTFLITFISCTLLFVGGAKPAHILVACLLCVIVAGAVVLLKYGYVIDRLTAFTNPESDQLGTGYQLRQSLIALGSGGFAGIGLGNSVQKLFYLPEPHSDFVMAILGEELGFLGIMSILLLLGALLCTSWSIIRNTKDKFSYFLAFGLIFYIILQAVISMAVITGSMPTKGMPMPFLSYGGSNLLFCWASCGILAGIARQNQVAYAQPAEPKS